MKRCRVIFHSSSLILHPSFIDRSAAVLGAADTAFVVGMQRRLVIDRDLFTSANVSKRDEEDVLVENLHECVWLA